MAEVMVSLVLLMIDEDIDEKLGECGVMSKGSDQV
jgi:hypothetical protein